jgi:hypothetical protein
MQLSHRYLKDSLQATSMGISSFMPKLFNNIMSLVPLTIIKEFNGLFKPGI